MFNGVTQANTNPTLREGAGEEAPKLAAHEDAIYLNAKLFHARGGGVREAGVAGAGSGVDAAGGDLLPAVCAWRGEPVGGGQGEAEEAQ